MAQASHRLGSPVDIQVVVINIRAELAKWYGSCPPATILEHHATQRSRALNGPGRTRRQDLADAYEATKPNGPGCDIIC